MSHSPILTALLLAAALLAVWLLYRHLPVVPKSPAKPKTPRPMIMVDQKPAPGRRLINRRRVTPSKRGK